MKLKQTMKTLMAAVLGSVLCVPVVAAPPSGGVSALDADNMLPDPRDMMRIEAAIDRGLDHLVRIQLPNGSFIQNAHNGISAFCLLAFLGRGHEPGRGPFKSTVDRAVGYLLSIQDANGFFPGTMYDHGLCTLALSEAYGHIPSQEVRKAVQKAVDLIVRSQGPLGGWRYQPQPVDQDLSVTVMQVVALRSAQNARFEVPQKTIDNAIKYVRACAAPQGGFGYQGPSAGPATTAAGTLSMALLGAFEDPSVAKSLDWMKTYQKQYYLNPGSSYFFYCNYYGMQAHFQAGGEAWAQWHPKIRDLLIERQNEDGSWPGFAEESYNAGAAKPYSTAMACMILEVYMHYLPAYQR